MAETFPAWDTIQGWDCLNQNNSIMRLFEFLKPAPRNTMNPTPNPSFNELERFHNMARALSKSVNTRHHYSRAGFAAVQAELFAKLSGFNVLVGFDNVIVEIPLTTTV